MQQQRSQNGGYLSAPSRSDAPSSLTSGFPSAASASTAVSPSSASPSSYTDTSALSSAASVAPDQDNAENWQQFELLLGNCCDRVLREIDTRFKSLAEHLWEDIDHNCATPEVIHSAFDENFVQIDDYLNKQFNLAKQQLDRVLQNDKPYPRRKEVDDPGGPPAIAKSSMSSASTLPEPFPTVVAPRRRSEPKPPDPNNAPLVAPSLLTYMRPPVQTPPPAPAPRRSVHPAEAPPTAQNVEPVPGPFTRVPRDSLTNAAARNIPLDPEAAGDYRGRMDPRPPSPVDTKPPYWMDEGYRDYRDLRPPCGPLINNEPKSLTSLFPRVTRTQSLFALGILVGICAAFVVLYLSPHLPACVRQYLPYHANQMWGRTLPPSYSSRSDASLAHRSKPYDAFWSSCGNSFVDWWTFFKQLFFY